MNETVRRIVDLLFEELKDSGEVRELREEVLSDSLAQYNDLVSRGLTEDEAVAAVMESLKGMEEVLSGYPRREAQDAPELVLEKKPVQQAETQRASADGIYMAEALEANLKNADICVVQGSRPGLSVYVEGDETGVIETVQNGDTLRITQTIAGSAAPRFSPGGEGETGSLSGFVLGILKKAMSVVSTSAIRITVEAGTPLRQASIGTASGDAKWTEVPVRKLDLSTASGDITATLSEPADSVSARAMSGDIDVKGCAREFALSSLSGDVSLQGSADRVSVRSTSGDADFTGQAAQTECRSTSGEVSIRLLGGKQAVDSFIHIKGSSTSGDVSVHLPQGTAEAELSLRTVSGSVEHHGMMNRPGAPVKAELSSVSGDVAVYPG